MDPNALSAQISQLDAGYNPTQVYNDTMAKLGVPDARARVQALQKNLIDTQNAISSVDPNVTARTSGSLVTENQRQRLVTQERQPLQETYGKQNQSYGLESQALTGLLGEANTQTGLAESGYKVKRQSLSDQLNLALDQQKQAAAKAEADRQYALQQQQLKVSAAKGGGSSGAQVNPGQEFLNYIASQFKSAGGQGNSKISRQTQDAWANAFFNANGVSQANRQQYWNLFNSTYNRVDDPTKDWRWAR